MFDSNAKYTLKLIDRSVNLRLPTDDELTARARSLVTVQRFGGGPPAIKDHGEAEKNFIAKIREQGDDAGEITEGEAIYLADRLLQVKVPDSVRIGNTFRITLKVPNWGAGWLEVVHVLRIPSIDAVQKYERTVSQREVKRNSVQSYDSMSGVAPFWATLDPAVEGYAEGSPVPLHHKLAAVEELIAMMNSEMGDPDPEV